MSRIANIVHVEAVPKSFDCFWESFSKLFAKKRKDLLRSVGRAHVAEEHAIPLVIPCFMDETMKTAIFWIKENLKEHLRDVPDDSMLELAKTKKDPS